PAARAAPESATTTAPPHSRSTSAACPSTRAGRRTTHSATSMRRSSTSRACNRAFCWRRGRWRASRPNGAARRRCNSWPAPASRASTTVSRSRPFKPWADPRPRSVRNRSRRWLADFGVDQVRSVSGNGSNTTFVNGDARYQLSRDTGLGGVVYVRRNDSTSAWSAEAYLDNANSSGIGRGQLDYATDRETRDATFTLQQTWDMRTGTRLSTTAAVERIRSTAIMNVEQDSTIVRLAVYGGGDLTARLALDGSVQWATALQGRAAPSRSADVSLTWQVARAWSVLASYYENRVGSWTPLVVTSPLAPPTPAVIAAAGERGVFLTVRYQEARGAHFVPLGGMPGSGSGRLSGVVYLDMNENGRYDAGESGAANVAVILDGRFSVRSDSNGRFDFPAVAAGHHVLSVQADNL